jgi:aryl-alcohol dehydrogenase-like predicted oxidoreductase
MTFGEDWGPVGTTVEESRDVLAAYLDRGGNFLDTANIYTKGHSERIIGDYFMEHPARRDRVVIATKFCGNMYPGDPNGGGAGRKAILHQVHNSLRRLRTDHIDLLWCHFWDRHTPLEETMRTMDDLVPQGKVRYIGFSDHPAWVCAKANGLAALHGWEPLAAIQIEYSLLQRTPEEDLIPMAMDLGVGVTPWSPLRGGVLSGKFRRDSRPKHGETRVADNSPHLNERTFALVDELVALGAEIGASPAQVALHWVQSSPGVTSTIIGAKRLSQLEDNLGALDITLSPDQRARLLAASAFDKHFPHNFLDTIRPAIQNGATINGQKSDAWPLSPKGDADRH